jgi:hypothetical protein
MAQQARLNEAVSMYQQGDATFSELAEKTGVNIEEIMDAVTAQAGESQLREFLDAYRVLAESEGDPDFYRLVEKATGLTQRKTERR